MRHPTDSDTPTCDPTPNDLAPALPRTGAYDWSRFGRHSLRIAGGVVIDFPLPRDARSEPWVATIWPEPRAPGGWGRAIWQPDPTNGRGWTLSNQLACGDLIEFGADHAHTPARWYGLVDTYDGASWLVLQGPYPTPADAHTDAERLLGAHRYQAPVIAPSTRCTRASRHRRPRP